MSTLLVLLFVFMIIAAIVAIHTNDLLSAVISLGAVGFGSSVVFLLLRAPDVAITQIVVEVLCLVLLIRATVWRGIRTVSGSRDTFGMAVSGVLVVILLVFTIIAFEQFPAFGDPVMNRVADAPAKVYIQQGLSETGAANLVGAVLLDFRAYDTLGEATVLFTAIIGALALLRRKSRSGEQPKE
jgi:multicomponent Na+:H+ antiporter subunit B